jgi:protein subunit release factor A
MFTTRICRRVPLSLVSQIATRVEFNAPKVLKNKFAVLSAQHTSLNELLMLADDEKDSLLKDDVIRDFNILEKHYMDLNMELSLGEDANISSCFVELRAGSGGIF